ncbi:MAG: hypothetical protein QXS41_01630 [Candidatus Woesearchaeota archaeon]
MNNEKINKEKLETFNFTGLTNYKLEKAIDNCFFDKTKLEIDDPEAQPDIIYYTVAPKKSIEAILKREPIIAFNIPNLDWGLEILGEKYYHKDYQKITENLFYPIIPALFAIYLVEEKQTPGEPIIIAFNNESLKKLEKTSFKSVKGIVKIDYIFLVEKIEYLNNKENYKMYLRDITEKYIK